MPSREVVRDVARSAVRRLFVAILPTILGIAVINFLLLNLAPGDIVDIMTAESGAASAEGMAEMREKLGLDQPVIIQLGRYLLNLAQFDLGYSPRYSENVSTLILSRLPASLALMISGFVLALVLGVSVGWIMAVWARKWPDHLCSAIVLFLYSMPGFWVGLMTIILFSVHLGWLPSGGSGALASTETGLLDLLSRLRYLILPAFALATFYIAIYARLTRTAMLEISSRDYVRAAQAKGISPFRLQLRHILRNALIPVTTIAGINLGNLAGGAVVIESVFGWPGIGRLALDAVMARDLQVLLGILLISSITVIAANILVDLLHMWLDPRTRKR